ncbi:hypothetical protein TRVA0_020S00606 [Trichomonascus vanleenenianus]|uniref:uncharacterized protein n=1 Tax=Trichomonascus vanleenenianus TaxID=2268995 RepID=UPI003ECB2912
MEEKKIDFINRLPIEVSNQILGYLTFAEWRKLRLVSLKWNDLCQPLAWEKVAIVPARNIDRFSIDPLMFDYSDCVELDALLDLETSYTVLTYQQLQNLVQDQQFQKVVATHTTELSVYYRYTNLNEFAPGENAHAFEVIAELFKCVTTVRVSYNLSVRDDMFLAFQRMLDKWKPTAEFYLGLNVHEVKGEKGYIDTDGMNIRELYVSRRTKDDEYDSDGEGDDVPRVWLCGVDEGRFGTAPFRRRLPPDPSALTEGLTFPLPLSRTQGKTPIEWRDLACMNKDLTRLSIAADCNAFQSFSVQESIKHLHITNCGVTNLARSQLIVSCGVEYLYVTDYFDFVRRRAPSVFSWLDLKRATQIKALTYAGPEFPADLEKAVVEVEGSLESLAVAYHCGLSSGTAKFRPLAAKGLGLKQLRVRVAGFNRTKGDYESYIGSYPELEQLTLDLIPFDTSSPDDRRFIKKLLARFLRGCPKLSRLQLRTNPGQRLNRAAEWMSWVSPDKHGLYVVHEVNLSKYKATIL